MIAPSQNAVEAPPTPCESLLCCAACLLCNPLLPGVDGPQLHWQSQLSHTPGPQSLNRSQNAAGSDRDQGLCGPPPRGSRHQRALPGRARGASRRCECRLLGSALGGVWEGGLHVCRREACGAILPDQASIWALRRPMRRLCGPMPSISPPLPPLFPPCWFWSLRRLASTCTSPTLIPGHPPAALCSAGGEEGRGCRPGCCDRRDRVGRPCLRGEPPACPD